MQSFVRYLNKNREVVHEPIDIEREIEGTLIEAALQYTDGFNELVYSFANTINTPDGGSHSTGLRAALTRTVNDYALASRACSRKATRPSPPTTRAKD